MDGSGSIPSVLSTELADGSDLRPSFPGFWPGVVVSDADPERAGRIRVRVPQVYGASEEEERIEDRDLPWARPCFPVTGLGTGEAHVPPVGATVWVSWFGSNIEKPIWFGGWFTPGDAPPELRSSYSPGPMTRIIRTAGGQVFEMRWKDGEEHIHLRTRAGLDLDMVDTPAGPKLTLLTPLQQKVEMSDPALTIKIETPGSVLVTAALNVTVTAVANVAVTAGGTASVVAAGVASVSGSAVSVASTSPIGTATTNAAGLSVSNFTGLATLNYLGALLMAVIGTLTMSATAALSITAGATGLLQATGILSLFGSAVLIGTLAGVKRKLVDERFFAAYNAHTHLALATPPPLVFQIGPVLPQIPVASVATTDVQAS
jgi:hypothetical protein